MPQKVRYKVAVNYIGDSIENGILYDYKKIRKLFKKLDCPEDLFDPFPALLSPCRWILDLSERSVGKTTQWLLVGMCMYWIYGTVIQYVRQFEDMIMPKASSDLFSTILKYDYVYKLTDGEYNTVIYKSRRWYFAYLDPDTMEVTRTCPDHFMFSCSIDKQLNLKSSYNCPTGDLIIFDEFIGKITPVNEFISFCDLCKTIQRERQSVRFILLANTIDKHHIYFNELCIYDQIQMLHVGEHLQLRSPLGTQIYVEFIGLSGERKKRRSVINVLYYGFKNPRLAAITGDDEWSMGCYQHIPKRGENEKDPQCISRQVYVLYNSRYVRLDLMQHPVLGTVVYAHWATQTYSDSVILTCDERTDPRYQHALGGKIISRLIKYMYQSNRIYYASNDVGNFLDSYLKRCKSA